MEEEVFDIVPVKNNGPIIQNVEEVSCEKCTKSCPLAGLKKGSAEWDAAIQLALIVSLASL